MCPQYVSHLLADLWIRIAYDTGVFENFCLFTCLLNTFCSPWPKNAFILVSERKEKRLKKFKNERVKEKC